VNIKALLAKRIEAAFDIALIVGPALIQTAGKPEFGDYQANGVMAAAKKAGKNPQEVAQQVIDAVDLDGIASELSIAGPGFINIRLDASFLAREPAGDVTQTSAPQTVVVDYSAPNLAKEMHVGHLRSTIIGDCIARVLEAQGHKVIRQNHVGDWGTQFGMLLTYLDESGQDTDDLADLEEFYRAAKQRFDADQAFSERSRLAVVNLQSGGEHELTQWRRFIDISMSHCEAIYKQLNVTLKPDDVRGESAYNDALKPTIEELRAQDLLRESNGALCVFLGQFKNKQGDALPVIVEKSDGGYLYATTDLAAIAYRTRHLQADRVLYFVDARQSLHFKQVFAVAEQAGLTGSKTHLDHMPFGTMLGADGKPFKTREGAIVKLEALLEEAIARAFAVVSEKSATEKNPHLDGDEIAALAEAIGIGAVKYADLSKNRTSDYVFDWDHMLSFDGNTAPYLQYAYTRIQSIFMKGQVDLSKLELGVAAVGEPERRLALAIAGFNDILDQVATEGFPHYLCGYLYDLATRFMQFYEQCPILTSADADRLRRLALAQQTALTLKQGLDLLGIDVVNQM
jgi:arginyl-tRNA synthetase